MANIKVTYSRSYNEWLVEENLPIVGWVVKDSFHTKYKAYKLRNELLKK